mmetsp:Transcript_29674/g.54656  ORF Transcript_29674/g.54656 Transcript_29674/m.54656 type:complete len:421 (-) Transcript_29674:76-1338(-)
MLLYDNRSLLRLVTAIYGSVFLRLDNITFGLIIAGVAALLQELVNSKSDYAPKLPHHYGMHALGAVIVFALVFRTNQGWGRYWEAVGQLHIMYSKWGDAFAQMFAFTSLSLQNAKKKGTPEADAKKRRLEAYIDGLTNNFILLSAIAAHRLSNGDTQKIEEKTGWSEKILKREVLQRCQSTFPAFKAVSQMGFAGNLDDIWDDHAPKGRARPDWIGRSAPQAEDGDEAPSPRLIKQDTTKSQREERFDWRHSLVVREVPDREESLLLEQSTDPASVVMFWIVHDLAELSKDLDIAPPIQTRMFQELSNGMLGFNQCVKLADVPFPFPYAQVLTIILACYTAFIPVYIVCFTSSRIVSTIMSFILFQGIWGLNETAKELENPFGPDVNDITLIDFHLRFMDQCEEILEAHMTMVGASESQS